MEDGITVASGDCPARVVPAERGHGRGVESHPPRPDRSAPADAGYYCCHVHHAHGAVAAPPSADRRNSIPHGLPGDGDWLCRDPGVARTRRGTAEAVPAGAAGGIQYKLDVCDHRHGTRDRHGVRLRAPDGICRRRWRTTTVACTDTLSDT